ncbi:hypothetical protein SY89_00047 [Halolamina pelagica]|uniref:CARDB domain-containing protein n=1 Tax=Halolamina pelagica TaxID=699431 RepID=A0A0P7HRP5_9EURY|nr:hypothetical protein [Halolamina pelagica]KPN29334.1 hypothetical protein SY89_00047 [Halolamina pelagica]
MTVEAAAVQYAYRHIENVDWNGIQPADGQFVFVTIDARAPSIPPDRAAFTLLADGEQYAPITPEYGYPVDLDVPGDGYTPDDGDADRRGWLLFETPAQLASAPTLRLDHDPEPEEWELSVENATSPPPAWEWSVDAPNTVAPDETFEITITAENVGDGAGTFRGAVNFSYPLYKPEGFDIPLDPGESNTATVAAEARDAEPGRELEYEVRTPTGETTVTVTVEGETETATDAG